MKELVVKGEIVRIAGPLVVAKGMSGAKMYEMVRVGEQKLIGEIIELIEDKASIQVYEETVGIKPGEEVLGTGRPLSVELGPGLLNMIFDGIQRPLEVIKSKVGNFIKRGIEAPALDRNKKWPFIPLVKKGDKVQAGDFLGKVQETEIVEHRILVPPGISGKIVEIAKEGEYSVEQTIATLSINGGKKELQMMHYWPVRRGRPFKRNLDPPVPLLTGQRIYDTFFPVAKGGTAAIPGPFGSGKTVSQHQLAKWADAEVIVYVGCGERGNEMTEVLEEFPELIDPKSGKPLMHRTSLIANTSNMPVAAREASVYTAITLCEYFRDMGYDVALMADSTSRWAEAMREISGRLEEMPGEEGYPAYLASRLADFYERAGRVVTLGSNERIGSVTVVGAVSPPGGDFSEPVTQGTLRITKCFWALDSSLADRRHFPAINWLTSYSLYLDTVESWWRDIVKEEWRTLRGRAMEILQKEAELKEIVMLVGPDALPEKERITLEGARILREDFLQQNAFHPVDTYCSTKKQIQMLRTILTFYERGVEAVSKGVPFAEIIRLPVKDEIARMKTIPENEFETKIKEIQEKMNLQFEELIKKHIR